MFNIGDAIIIQDNDETRLLLYTKPNTTGIVVDVYNDDNIEIKIDGNEEDTFFIKTCNIELCNVTYPEFISELKIRNYVLCTYNNRKQVIKITKIEDKSVGGLDIFKNKVTLSKRLLHKKLDITDKDFENIKKKVEARRDYKIDRDCHREREIYDECLTTVNNIHYKSGEVFDLYNKIQSNLIERNKSPLTNTNYVGIEIEFKTPFTYDQVKDVLVKNNLSKTATFKTDGSVHSTTYDVTHNGFELCLLIKENELENKLKHLHMVMRELKSIADKECGLHIHLDMRNRNVEKSYTRLFNSQDVIIKSQPLERKYSTYCKPNQYRSFLEEANVSENTPSAWERCNTNRYKVINPLSYKKLKTLEIRNHRGTTNCFHIYNWIKFLINIADNEKLDGINLIDSFDELKSKSTFDQATINYIESSIDMFAV